MSPTDSENDSEGKKPKVSTAETASPQPRAGQSGSGAKSRSKTAGSKAAGEKAEGSASKGKKKAAPKVPLTEAEINAPSINTLIMLGVMSITTLVLWAAGRAACNYHVPGESLTPRAVSLEDRTRQPKDVGIEFGQALSGADFGTASKLARGEGSSLVEQAKVACGSCDKEKLQRDQLLSTAIVHKANSVDSIIEVNTYLGQKKIATRFLGIEREARQWRVTRAFPSLRAAELIAPPSSGSPLAPLSPADPNSPESESEDGSEPALGSPASPKAPGTSSAVPPGAQGSPSAPSPQGATSKGTDSELPAPIRLNLPPPQPQETTDD